MYFQIPTAVDEQSVLEGELVSNDRRHFKVDLDD